MLDLFWCPRDEGKEDEEKEDQEAHAPECTLLIFCLQHRAL
jgi:hypothetical protein